MLSMVIESELCLSEDLRERLTAAELKVLMSKTITMNKSIVEETLGQLQEYAESLEDRVAARTRDLITEIHKVDDLLREMPPVCVLNDAIRWMREQKSFSCQLSRSCVDIKRFSQSSSSRQLSDSR